MKNTAKGIKTFKLKWKNLNYRQNILKTTTLIELYEIVMSRLAANPKKWKWKGETGVLSVYTVPFCSV